MKMVLKDNEILLIDSYPYKDIIKEIPSRKWDRVEKVWRVPITLDCIEILRTVMKLDANLEGLYQSHKELKRKTEVEKTVSHVEPVAPMPIKVKAFQHQIKGYNMALRMMGVME